MTRFTTTAFCNFNGQKAHRGHNRPEIASGTRCYAVHDTITGGYFAYGYTTFAAAEAIAEKLNAETNLDRMVEFNFRPRLPLWISDNRAEQIR